jgi:flagellin-like protein
MNPIRAYRKNKKGINTILAALLMVVIVVVAAVMVYAWATGLLGTLLVNPNNKVGNESLNMDSYSYNNATSVAMYIRDSGSAAVSLQSYYIKDSSGNQWQNTAFTAGPINPNSVLQVNLGIPSSTSSTTGSGCAGNCIYSGTSGAFTSFQSGYSYTVIVVTTRNNQFTFTITR